MKIAAYLKTSLIEWPGKISSVIFTSGCNLRCGFCHNADLVDAAKFNSKLLLSEEEVLADLKKRKNWIEAVVVTGGEPTLQKDLIKFLKSLEYPVMIHTNGTNPGVIRNLIIGKLVNYICMDLKGDLENYSNYSNCPNGQITASVKKSLGLIAGSGVECEFRTTVVPGLHDLGNLMRLAEELRSTADSLKWFLQQFRPMNTLDKKFMKIKPFSKEELESFQKELQKVIPNTFLRGI